MGAPNVLRSDNGPQYRSAMFQRFLKHWGVKWVNSSPHNHQSNGHAEVSVKAVEHLVMKYEGNIDSDEFHAGMLELRNSPRADNLSPAQRLFGHPLRSQVPAHWRLYDPKWQQAADMADRQRLENSKKRKFYYDRSTKAQKTIPIGTTVIVQDPISKRWDSFATVIGTPSKRRYHLRFLSGRVLWRNLKFIRVVPPKFADPKEDDNVKVSEDKDRKQSRRSNRTRQKPVRLNYK